GSAKIGAELARCLPGQEPEALAQLVADGTIGEGTIVLVGGYGMGFGEAGLLADAGTVSEVDLAVPLMIRPAPELEMPVGKRISALVSLVDVGPTIMSMHGVPYPKDLAGQSMSGLMRGITDKVRDHAFALADIHAGFAVIDDRGMLVHSLPQVGGPPGLGESWFGLEKPGEAAVELLLPRGAGLLPNAHRGGIADEERAQELRALGEAWAKRGLAIRDAVFVSPVKAGRVEASVREASMKRPVWLEAGPWTSE
ncbi:MAG: hypothetical protein JKY61_11900, partial [Planctomycetes bacterium]|nr:hypothetical protein [Planctomycetota bacterium]